MSESDYYIIEGGTARKLFDAWNKNRVAQSKKRGAFLKRYRTKRYYGNDQTHGISGLMFEKEPSDAFKAAWRRNPRAQNSWVPRRDTAEGKKLCDEMWSLGDPPLDNVTSQILNVGNILNVHRIHFPGLDWVDHKPVLVMPNPFEDGKAPKPIRKKDHYRWGVEYKLVDGVRKLLKSEYWRMKEEESNKDDRAKIPRLRERKKAASA